MAQLAGARVVQKLVSPRNPKYFVSSTQRAKLDRLTGQGAAESLQTHLYGLKVSLAENNRAFPKTRVWPHECNHEVSFLFGLQAHYTPALSTRHVGVPSCCPARSTRRKRTAAA